MPNQPHLIVEDITTLAVDAIVNAANESLMGGGGVDGAIHRAAGPELKAYNKRLAPCPAGEARISPGFQLPAKHIIHTVGPVWNGGEKGEAQLLAACYRNSLALAEAYKLTHIAFPSISTGAYGYPLSAAARVALSTIGEHLANSEAALEVTLCLFSEADYQVYRQVHKELQENQHG